MESSTFKYQLSISPFDISSEDQSDPTESVVYGTTIG